MDASEVLFPPLDSPQQLSEYAATYYSDELDADYKLTLKGNNLILQISQDLEAPLTAAYADFFYYRGVNLSFTRGDKGKITGFVFSAVGEREDRKLAISREDKLQGHWQKLETLVLKENEPFY